MKLTETQKRLLEGVDEICSSSGYEWMCSGNCTTGELSSLRSLERKNLIKCVAYDECHCCMGYCLAALHSCHSMYALTDAGKKILQTKGSNGI